MVAFDFKHVRIESVALQLPPEEVTSAQIEDRMAALYERLQVPFGTLEKLSGVKTRYVWSPQVRPSQAATMAARSAIDKIGFDRENLKALFSCSVSRDYFEPATSTLVHRNLEFSENSIAMDISNACIGFSNGMLTLAGMIESGAVKAGLVVSGESVVPLLDATFDLIQNDPKIDRERLIELLPTFTLGCGAAAMVLAHESIATQSHKLQSIVTRSATQHNMLCVGDRDYCHSLGTAVRPIMTTDSQGIIGAAAELGARAFVEMSERSGLSKDDIDHIFCHQVGRQVNAAFYEKMGLDHSKEFSVYQRYGNLVSASLPAAFFTGIDEKGIKSGERILLTAFGSGLNAIFSNIIW